MRTRILLFLTVLGCASPTAAPPSPQQEDLRRLSSILDYVAADYPAAVQDGKVLDQGEYAEQLSFILDAAALAQRLPASSVDAVAGVRDASALIAGKAAPEKVSEAARALRRKLLEAHGLVIAPTAPPDRQRAALLYAQSCALCHGTAGAADGPQARGLAPPPRSFIDPRVMAELTPTRAFNALTDGIRGTAMPSWGMLSPGDRWSLAFFVLGLRHDPEAALRGASAVAGRKDVPATPLADLANLRDPEIMARLAALPPAARADVLAYLRAAAPFAPAGGASLAEAQRLVRLGVAAYRGGDALGGRQAVGGAYLDVFEQYEAALRVRDPQLVVTAEDSFLGLREAMSAGAPLGDVELRALKLEEILGRAERVLGGGGGAGVAFASAMVVILREGVEAALLIMLLLGLARRAAAVGDVTRDTRSVHAGWLVAAAVGVGTWFASEPIIRLGGARRELIEGLIALFAAAVLLVTGHFVVARLDAKHRVDAIKRRLAAAGSGTSRRLALAGLAFVAVYREAFEVVLFLRAIALDGDAPPAMILAGVGAGTLLLVLIVFVLMKLGRRLSPGPLLATMGTLLCVLAVVLAGKGIRALQEAGVISIRPLDVPRIEWLGLFPSLQGVAAQVTVLLAFFLIAALAVRARRQAG